MLCTEACEQSMGRTSEGHNMLLSLGNKTLRLFLGGKQHHVGTHLPQVWFQGCALHLCTALPHSHPFVTPRCSLAQQEQATCIAAQEAPGFL